MTTLAWIVATAALLVGACIGVVVGGWNKAAKKEVPPICTATTKDIAICMSCGRVMPESLQRVRIECGCQCQS